MGPYNYEWRFSYNGPGNYGAPVSSSKSYTQSFPECTHYVKLTVASGSETDVAIQLVYVYSGYAKSTTTEDEQAGAKVEAPKPSKAGPERTMVTLAV